MSALKELQENAIDGKQSDSAQEETLAVYATAIRIVERKPNRPLLVHRRHRMTGRSSSKG